MKLIISLSFLFVISAYASSFDTFNSVMLENIETVIENNPEHFESEKTQKASRSPASIIDQVNVGPSDVYNSENLSVETVQGRGEL